MVITDPTGPPHHAELHMNISVAFSVPRSQNLLCERALYGFIKCNVISCTELSPVCNIADVTGNLPLVLEDVTAFPIMCSHTKDSSAGKSTSRSKRRSKILEILRKACRATSVPQVAARCISPCAHPFQHFAYRHGGTSYPTAKACYRTVHLASIRQTTCAFLRSSAITYGKLLY